VRLTLALLVAILAFAAGCNKTETQNAATEQKPKAQPVPAPVPATDLTLPPPPISTGAAVVENDSDVLVEVNGTKLLRSEAKRQVEKFLAANGSRIPPQYKEMARKQMLKSAIEQFVGKTLITQEMDKRNIQVSQAEEDAMRKDIAASLPEGMTLDDILKKNPEKADQLKEQLRNLVKADKMLGDRIKVSDADITDFMAKNKEKLAIPENVHARHILIAFDEKDTDKTKADKKKKAEDIRAQLVKGADFAQLAKDNSDCPSKQNGGDLGVFPKDGQMDPVFSAAAFSQTTNAIGQVVETKFGYHIIQVLAHSKAGTVSRDQVKFELKQEKRDKAVDDLVKELKVKANIKYLEPPTEDPSEATMPE
jgi:peptidyl-prolyl cis-trans isomerase C